MRDLMKILAGIAIATVTGWLACQVSGCASAGCLGSDSTVFPVVEKWWK